MEKNNQSVLMCFFFPDYGFKTHGPFVQKNKNHPDLYTGFNQICSQND